MSTEHQSKLRPANNKFHVGNGEDPIDKWVLMILSAIGTKVRNLGDVRWCSIEDGKPGKGTGRHIAAFILESKVEAAK